MGAWIEILEVPRTFTEALVAPFVGAWIEISVLGLAWDEDDDVAPFVGAWIEIYLDY